MEKIYAIETLGQKYGIEPKALFKFINLELTARNYGVETFMGNNCHQYVLFITDDEKQTKPQMLLNATEELRAGETAGDVKYFLRRLQRVYQYSNVRKDSLFAGVIKNYSLEEIKLFMIARHTPVYFFYINLKKIEEKIGNIYIRKPYVKRHKDDVTLYNFSAIIRDINLKLETDFKAGQLYNVFKTPEISGLPPSQIKALSVFLNVPLKDILVFNDERDAQ